MEPVRNYQKKQILKECGNQCCYCGGVFDRADLEIDHMLPRSRGGLNEPQNLVAACSLCNSRKRTKTPGEFLRHAKKKAEHHRRQAVQWEIIQDIMASWVG